MLQNPTPTNQPWRPLSSPPSSPALPPLPPPKPERHLPPSTPHSTTKLELHPPNLDAGILSVSWPTVTRSVSTVFVLLNWSMAVLLCLLPGDMPLPGLVLASLDARIPLPVIVSDCDDRLASIFIYVIFELMFLQWNWYSFRIIIPLYLIKSHKNRGCLQWTRVLGSCSPHRRIPWSCVEAKGGILPRRFQFFSMACWIWTICTKWGGYDRFEDKGVEQWTCRTNGYPWYDGSWTTRWKAFHLLW